MSIATRVQQIVSDQFGVNLEEVTPDSSLAEDLGADELDIVELVMELEHEFKIEISDEVADDLNTVGKLTHYIEEVLL